MRKILLLFIGTILLFPLAAFGGNTDSALRGKVNQWMNSSSGIRFLENKGQMYDEQRKPVPNVLYEASSGGMNVYVTTSGLSYVFTKYNKFKKKSTTSIIDKRHQHDSVTIDYCRADMQLVGASIKKENIEQEGESTDRSDYYYGGICPDGILDVHSYTKITIKNIYPGIDWVLHGSKKGFKYDFIVHPGSDPSVIKLHYKWTDQPKLQADSSIKISTPMGTITEGTPESFSSNEQVITSYQIQDTNISFKVGNYNTAQTLIIDPVLMWGTYYGSNNLDDVLSMQADGTNVWVTGLTSSTDFPTYNPAGGAYFQGTFLSSGTTFILQFNVAGVLKWATYYGGSAEDIAYSIYSDTVNVWVTGQAFSTDFPTFNPGGGAYFQGALNGGNAFILKFDMKGVRKWATFYGGSNSDGGNSIQSDGRNVWVTGIAASTDFPTYNPGGGAYFQGTLASVNGNAFILQFNTAGMRKWATYYGGSGGLYGEYGTSINSDGSNVWVTGVTTSQNFPIFNPGGGAYYQGTFGGTETVFILKFDTTGVRKWATYYGGSIEDLGYSINSDGTNVWVTGQTSSTDFPTLNPGGGAYYQGTLATSPTYSNAFILKFNTAGVSKWATYYGGSGGGIYDEVGYSIQSDGSSVWVCGGTPSIDFPTLNSGCGYNKDSLGIVNGDEAFILQFNPAGVREWATYYGADVEDDGSYAWSDGKNLFVTGDALYKGYPTINPGGGAYYVDTLDLDTVPNTEIVFIGKFIIGGLNINPSVSICRGGSTMLHASGSVSYNWSPPTGLSATNIANPVASPTVTTTYTVTGIDTGACGGTFRDSVTVSVDTLGKIRISNDTTICFGSSVSLHASGGGIYYWNNGDTASSIFLTHDSITKTYSVTINSGACKADTSVKVTVMPLPKPAISGNTKICSGDSEQLTVAGGNTYLWSNGSKDSIYYTGIINKDSTITVTAYNSLGCPHDTTITIIPEPLPNLSACCDATIKQGNDTTLVAIGNSKLSYQWSPAVNCLNPICDSVNVSPIVTTTYTVTATDSLGCTVERTVTIVVEKSCFNFIVPNVFTPDYLGTNGINNVFYIKTVNLDSWNIIIYDRWGKVMYNSTNPNQYWDGTTKNGDKAPAGVYYYIINATCQNTSYKKDGFVQLIR